MGVEFIFFLFWLRHFAKKLDTQSKKIWLLLKKNPEMVRKWYRSCRKCPGSEQSGKDKFDLNSNKTKGYSILLITIMYEYIKTLETI